MGLLQVLLILITIGVALWAVNAYIPMQAGFKKLINIVAIVAAVLWLRSCGCCRFSSPAS